MPSDLKPWHHYRARVWWKTRDGRDGVYEDTDEKGSLWTDEDGDLHDYMWGEGNYSCDCNRALLFLGENWECGELIKVTRIEAIGGVPFAKKHGS